MKRPHPNRPYAVVATALLVTVSVAGCRGQQTALSNPFLSPDRVPPPSTRFVPPGTAQPYYPGDPLPTAEYAPTPAAPADSFAASEDPSPEYAPARAIAASGESPIAIPGDADDLRFALPPPPDPPTVAAAAAQPPMPSPTVAAAVGPSSAPPPAVVPAVYTAADAYQVTPSDPAMADSGPWRPPQIPQSGVVPTTVQNSPAMFFQPQAPQPVVPVAAQASLASLPPPPITPVGAAPLPTMPVQLRAVPSPPLEVASSAAPRIRFADPAAPIVPPGTTPNNSVGPAAYFAPVPGSVVQTVEISELPPGATYAPGSVLNVAAQPQTGVSVSPDGFRPRGSTW
jgi:hypothetical protein